MVAQYGMSDTLGPIAYSADDSNVFLGKDLVIPKITLNPQLLRLIRKSAILSQLAIIRQKKFSRII